MFKVDRAGVRYEKGLVEFEGDKYTLISEICTLVRHLRRREVITDSDIEWISENIKLTDEEVHQKVEDEIVKRMHSVFGFVFSEDEIRQIVKEEREKRKENIEND